MKKLSRSLRYVATGLKFALTEPHSDRQARTLVTLWSVNVCMAMLVIGLNLLMWGATSAFWFGLFMVWGSMNVVWLCWAYQGLMYRRRLAHERAEFYALIGMLNGKDA